jgi:hypothetical protein
MLQGKWLENLWNTAGLKVNSLARERDWEDEFTAEERDEGVERVKTGLRRVLDDDDEDDEGDGGDGNGLGGEDGGKSFGNAGTVEGLRLDGWLRFGSTGRVAG